MPKIEDRLQGSELVAPWWPLLEECFASYRDGRYAVAIPGLIAVIEGVVIGSLEDVSVQKTDVSDVAESYLKSYEDKAWHYGRVLAKSMAAFIDRLFRGRGFGQKRPTVINRHWILHGRDFPSEWRQVDVLRLFNALDTTVAALPAPSQDSDQT